MNEIKDLMLPRYRVSQEGYPDMIFSPGQILTLNHFDADTKQPYWLSPKKNHWYPNFFDRFPAIFSPLPWYSERKPEDMDNLDYLKDIGDGEIFQAECLNNGMCYVKPNNPKEGDLRYTSLEHFLPATSTQYIEYVNSKQKA